MKSGIFPHTIQKFNKIVTGCKSSESLLLTKTL